MIKPTFRQNGGPVEKDVVLPSPEVEVSYLVGKPGSTRTGRSLHHGSLESTSTYFLVGHHTRKYHHAP